MFMCACLLANSFSNLFRIPEWASEVFKSDSNFEYLAEYWLKFNSGTTQLKRLKSGFLLKEILDRFQNKTAMTLTPDYSLWIYSGHDITIANMLNSLGLFEVNSTAVLFNRIFFFLSSCLNSRISSLQLPLFNMFYTQNSMRHYKF